MKPLAILVLAVAAMPLQAVSGQEPRLYNPYERPKNGPPLTNIFHKAETAWILRKLRDPKHHPSARMADFKFSDDEALDGMAWLKSIAEAPVPEIQWPAWAAKGFDEMDDHERDAMFAVVDHGKAIWGNARCTICHIVNGPGGTLTGGFVDLRVGGVDLQAAATKLKRDWLYAWIKNPRNHFPDTLMPRYRFSEDQIKALVEYILRDDAFLPLTDEEAEGDLERWRVLDEPARVSRGKRVIELSRCVLCHDIKGIPEMLNLPKLEPPAPERRFEFLVYDLRCLSCHSIEGRGGTYAPELTGEGSRLHEAWIANFLRSPDIIRPLSQQMPKFNLTSEEAKLIASSLGTRRDARIPPGIPGGPVTAEDMQRGREVFNTRGCVSCHRAREGQGGVVGPDLVTVGDRLRPGYVWFHLKNPHAVNPTSAEPDYGLPDEEARTLAAYLSTRKTTTSLAWSKGMMAPAPVTAVGVPQAANGEEELINRRDQARRAFLATLRGIYDHYCAHCHGDDGDGGGRLWATDLSPSPADLTALGADKEYLLEAVRDGSAAHGKSNLCPPWGRTLSLANVERMTQYIASLGGERSPPSSNPVEPVREPFPWLLVGVLLGEMVILWWLLRRKQEISSVP